MTNWLTLSEAAEYLKLGKSTIYKLARERSIPAHRAGRIWRFDAAELDMWMKSRSKSPSTVRKFSSSGA